MNIKQITLATTMTSISCADPIIGNWSGTQVCDSGDCYSLPLERDGTTYGVSMVIEDSLSGNFILTSSSDGTTYSNQFSIEVEAEGNGSYDIIVDRGEDESMSKMSCTRTSIELECSESDVEFTFKKDN